MIIQPIPRHFLLQLNRIDRRVQPLEAAIMSELAAGRLKPGDPIPNPQQLAKQWNLSPIDVLESLSEMLTRGIVRQNRNGDLHVAANINNRPPGGSPRQHAA